MKVQLVALGSVAVLAMQAAAATVPKSSTTTTKAATTTTRKIPPGYIATLVAEIKEAKGSLKDLLKDTLEVLKPKPNAPTTSSAASTSGAAPSSAASTSSAAPSSAASTSSAAPSSAASSTTTASNTAATTTAAGCTDIAPDTTYTCQQQASWGKCTETWMSAYCDQSCGRCGGASSSTTSSAAATPTAAVCSDIQPEGGYTCAEQAGWGKCTESWMAGYCDKTCGRCVAPEPTKVLYRDGLQTGFDNWSWNLNSFDTAYPGPPAIPAAAGTLAIKADVQSWGGVAIYNGPGFAQFAKLTFYAAGYDGFTIQITNTAGGLRPSAMPLTSVCTGAFSADAFVPCTVDLVALGSNGWNRIDWQNTGDTSNVLYLAGVQFTGTAPPAPAPTTTSAAPAPTGTGIDAWCYDVAPSPDYTCEQQASWGKCSEAWMGAYCYKSCNRCPSAAAVDQPYTIGDLIDTGASAATKNLYNQIKNNFGTKVFSGQSETANAGINRDIEFNYVKNLTGKTPAIRMFDFIFYFGDCPFEDGSMDRALAWGQQGGIVSFQWHWSVPGFGNNNCGGFYTKDSNFSVTLATTPGTWENTRILSDIAKLITKFQILQDAGIPVLFRPLHEPDGAWFWWGREGGAPYVALWNIIQSEFS